MFSLGAIAVTAVPTTSVSLLSNTITLGSGQLAYDDPRRGFARGSYGSLTDDGTNASTFLGTNTGKRLRLSAFAVAQNSASNQILMWLDIVGPSSSNQYSSDSPVKEFDRVTLGSGFDLNYDDATSANISQINGYYTRHAIFWDFGGNAWNDISSSGLIGYEFFS